MRFACFCYYEPAKYAAWCDTDRAAVLDACAPHDQALRSSGRLLLQTSLAEPDEAVVIRPTERGPAVSRGAYAPVPEPLGAMFFVDAPDMEAAVQVASLHPSAHFGRYFGGGIEVRAFDHYMQFEVATT